MYENNHRMHYFDEDSFSFKQNQPRRWIYHNMHILEICDKSSI